MSDGCYAEIWASYSLKHLALYRIEICVEINTEEGKSSRCFYIYADILTVSVEVDNNTINYLISTLNPLQEGTPDEVLQNIAFSYNLLDQAAISMTLFDQIKFVQEWYQALVNQKGKAPNHLDLAKTLPSSGTMSHKWSVRCDCSPKNTCGCPA